MTEREKKLSEINLQELGDEIISILQNTQQLWIEYHKTT